MRTFAILMALAASPASAEVVAASANGFHVRHSVDVPVPPAAAFAAFVKPGRWWAGSHTYSGDGARMTMDASAGGCFCERLDGGGGIEHMRVTYVQPGARIVLTGSLGPLLYEATAGAMDVKFEPAGAGTRVTMDYKAAGFATGGADKMAPLVDTVLGDQLALYRGKAR